MHVGCVLNPWAPVLEPLVFTFWKCETVENLQCVCCCTYGGFLSNKNQWLPEPMRGTSSDLWLGVNCAIHESLWHSALLGDTNWAECRTAGRKENAATVRTSEVGARVFWSPAPVPTQPVQWVLRVKRSGREAHHFPPSSVEVKNEWDCASPPPYDVMLARGRLYRELCLV